MLPILARTFFRVHERLLGRPTFRILRELEDSQWWPRERLEALQVERLRAMAAVAYEHTPYWRQVMDARGLRPGDIRGLDDLRRLPLLDKETIRARREEMVWRRAGRRVRLVRTSGSTNEALQFYTSALREAHINAARMRGHAWVGIRRGERELYFWGSPVELNSQDRLKRVRDWLVNDGLSNGFALTEDLVERYVRQWRRWRPRCIFGYPSSLALLVHMAGRRGLELRSLAERGLRVIVTTSEMLTDVDRRTISEAFGVPVYDSYGLREAGLVGHECAEGTMHCMDEQVILETIDPDTHEPIDGEGELVVTNLMGPAMPVLRYRSGDLVTLSRQPCACGRDLSHLRVSGGRIADFVVTTNGVWIPGYAFIYICRAVPGIVKFQARQEQRGRVEVLLEVDEHFPADGTERVHSAVRARLQSDDEVAVRVVPDIAPAPSGKYRPVVGVLAQRLRAGHAAPDDGEPPR